MKYKIFGNTVIARIDKGEEIVSSILEICKKENIKLGKVSAIGAVNKVKIGLFKTGEKKYYSDILTGEFEITSLLGNVTTMNDEVYLHLHINISDSSFKTFGGHLNEAYVSGTCELFIDVIDGHMDRKFSEEIGLNLLEFDYE
ncbi:MAG TPA: DNA-binding protein [Clostridiaceae bacterium]|nr:DNA-binding protein [Clostridiaceae bacterium]